MLSRLNILQYLPTRKEQSQKTQLEIDQKRISRRKAIKRILRFTTAAAVYGAYELSQNKGDGRPAERISYTKNEIVQLVKESINGDISFIEKYESDYPHSLTQSNLTEESVEMMNEATGQIYETGGNLIHNPYNTSISILSSLSDATEFSLRYQSPKVETSQGNMSVSNTPDSNTDCNDYAYRICQILAKKDIPAYLLSVWPKESRERFRSDWHQMATFKIDDDEYIIIDNAKVITIWHGSLQEFVHHYKLCGEVPAGYVIHGGIAPYLKPKWNNPASRIAIQAWNATSEDKMENVLINPNSIDIAGLRR